MPAGVVSRLVETRAVADFLAAVSTEPAALVLEGEPGIGKATLWLAALQQARERGFLLTREIRHPPNCNQGRDFRKITTLAAISAQ
jgi:hypothetical protein